MVDVEFCCCFVDDEVGVYVVGCCCDVCLVLVVECGFGWVVEVGDEIGYVWLCVE